MRPSRTPRGELRLASALILSTAALAHAGAVETFVTFAAPVEEVNVAPDGTLYLPSPSSLGAVKKVTPDGTKSNLATGIALPEGGTVDDAGHVYVSAWNTGVVHRIEPDGTMHTVATGLAGPTGNALSPDGRFLYVSQYSANSIAKVDLTDGSWTVFASQQGIFGPDGVTVDGEGGIYISNFLSSDILHADSTGAVSLVATLPGSRTGYCEYRDGILWVAGNNTHRVYAVRPDGTWWVVAGTGVAGHVDGPPTVAQFDLPNGIALSVTGDTLFVADNGAQKAVRRVLLNDPTGVVESLGAPTAALDLRLAPNPFVREAEIAYSIPSTGDVSVAVYDAAGRLVRSLVPEEVQRSGRHAVRWDGTRDGGGRGTPGVYFVRVTWDGTTTGARLVRLDR